MLYAATSGLVTVFGMDVVRDPSAIKSRIGIMPQDNNLDPDLSVTENLTVYARYFDIRKKDALRLARVLLEFVELADKADAKIDQLSGGMKHRLLLARSLVNKPDLLILDEPTTGLDPHSRRAVWDKLNHLKARNTTLLLTTHYMEEAERLCDRVAIMDSGRIKTVDTPGNLMAAHGGNLESVYLRLTGRSLRIKRMIRVWQRHWTVYTKLYKTSFALNFAEPALYLVAMGFGLGLAWKIAGQPYVKFIAPGIIASSSMFAAVYECTYGTYIRMTFQKTFDAILATPINLEDLIHGELVWGATKSVIFGITITIVVALFGLVDSPLILLALPFIFLCGLIFAQLSVMFAAVVPGIDSFSYFYTLFMTPLFLFSGIFFPLDSMPTAVARLAFFTPLYHLVNICRAFSAGELQIALWSMVWIIVVVALLAQFPFKLMRKRIIV